jgi:predicted GNAT superfamily acetyltransferase
MRARRVSQPKRAEYDIRMLTSQEDYAACVALQRRTWGESFNDVVPPSILQVSQKLGGISAGAFDKRGTMVGFVFGMTGVQNGNVVHWSDMLAVIPKLQGQGIGRSLKEFQRDAVAKLGAKVIYWTYDPLVARNAHLNINVFGVRVAEYVEDMYGDSHSPLHRGIGTDRFIVAWPVDDADLGARREEIARATRESQGGGRSSRIVEIPLRIDQLQSANMNAARKWRRVTREAFLSALTAGYSVNGFYTDEKADRGYYILTR